MKKRPEPFIHHIIDAAAAIEEYLSDCDFELFAKTNIVQDAVLRKIGVIGEACTNLEEGFKQSYPNIPWKKISGMRNRLTHEYWDIDLEIVWTTATVDIPSLKQQLVELLEKIPSVMSES
ncbi:MAG TPA: DUF86 domain-containing protein [Candidatus Woesebacteria bacterium]|mgnify:CR=1 FL=1|jgi:uncharacterized protein with HEPN domain|nr:DUF86 domain-containing protein [Candidatus Woesebacteria bacterium]